MHVLDPGMEKKVIQRVPTRRCLVTRPAQVGAISEVQK